MLVSGIVLIAVFILTLVFGILRIVKAAPLRTIRATTIATGVLSGEYEPENEPTTTSESYALTEDVSKLIIELVFILFAILGTFILHRYVKAKYDAVPTTDTPATATK